MRAATDLCKIRRVVRKRLARVRVILSVSADREPEWRNVALTWVLIELDNLIINLFREYLVSCLLRCRTCSGHRVSHQKLVNTQEQAALFIMSVLEPGRYKKSFARASTISRREETKFRDPNKLLAVALSAGLSNSAAISTALSLNTPAFAEISKARHFFAHRNIETAAELALMAHKRGISSAGTDWEVVDSLLPSKPYTLLEEWLADVGQFGELLTT